ncbi:MAG TPA: porin family protein [Candidatus Krumholzibacteria bacterium]|nr:porin family protein [Candidatus Krumholzibacteria bacterium]
MKGVFINMKKFVLSTCVMGLLVMGAVPADAAKWAGFKGGVNMADVSGDDVEALVGDTEMRNGFSGGAFFGVGIGEQFGVQIEGLYVMKGAKADDAGTEVTLKTDYIEFPILFVAKLPAGDKLNFNLFGGPTLGFNIKAEVEEGGVTTDIKDDTKSFEFGAAIGAGFEYMLESFSIIADVRYSLGASSILEDVGGESIDAKNRGIGIMAGVSFPIGSN